MTQPENVSVPKRFRKKPVVISAIQWTGENYRDVVQFVTSDPFHALGRKGEDLLISTLEDGPGGEAKHYASLGDYIIRGVKGEYYPCKPDIFAQTYEAAAPSPEPRAVEGVKSREQLAAAAYERMCEVVQGQAEMRGIEPAPQSAPAPLTEDERAMIAEEIAEIDAVIELNCDDESEVPLRAALVRAIAIADHHRDSVGRKT
jgi:hypothetical protein